MGTSNTTSGRGGRGRAILRRAGRVGKVSIVGLFAVLVLNGAAAKPKAKKGGAWFNARNFVAFPLADDAALPTDPAALTRSITRGWKRSPLNLANAPADPIVLAGRFPSLDAMRVDLSNVEFDSKRKSAKVADKAKTLRTLGVADLQLSASPVRVGPSRLSFGVAASDATFAVKRDRAGKPLMTMTDARAGRVEFAMTKADVERLLLHSARENAAKLGFNVTDVKLAISADSDREARGELDVRTKFAFIGANLHFTGRVTIADDMTARVTDLTCEGDDVLGPVVVGLLRPALAKVNNQTKPVVAFPSTKLKLTDVRLSVDDTIRVTAAFGR